MSMRSPSQSKDERRIPSGAMTRETQVIFSSDSRHVLTPTVGYKAFLLTTMSPRRSSRIQEKRASVNNSPIQNQCDDSNSEEVQVKPVRKPKKAKTPASTTRKQNGANVNPEVFRRTRGKRGL